MGHKMKEEEKVDGRIDWERVNASLPYQRGEEQQEERRKLWRAIDVSGSGLLSLAKVTRGIRDVVGLDLLFDCRPAINRAFHYSKDVSKRRGGPHTADYLVFKEFRVFLQALRQFFEFYQAFDRLDKAQDRRISRSSLHPMCKTPYRGGLVLYKTWRQSLMR